MPRTSGFVRYVAGSEGGGGAGMLSVDPRLSRFRLKESSIQKLSCSVYTAAGSCQALGFFLLLQEQEIKSEELGDSGERFCGLFLFLLILPAGLFSLVFAVQ